MSAACANRPTSVAKGSNQLFAWPGRGPLAQPRVCGASSRPLGRRRRLPHLSASQRGTLSTEGRQPLSRIDFPFLKL
jgi:hypothetical protein